MLTNLHNFLSDADFSALEKIPDAWPDAIRSLRNEMTTHAVILGLAYLFELEINVINWEGESVTTWYVYEYTKTLTQHPYPIP